MRSGLLEIKGLDGERKALVYDNYSKLIAATDTIRKVWSLPRVRRGKGRQEILMERFCADALQHGSADPNYFDPFSRHLTYRRNGDIVVNIVSDPRLDRRRDRGVGRRQEHDHREETGATGDRKVGLRSPTVFAGDARCG